MAGPTDLQHLNRRLREQQEGTPEREAFLEELARKVRAGEYRVAADELAARLLDVFETESRAETEPGFEHPI